MMFVLPVKNVIKINGKMKVEKAEPAEVTEE